MFYYNQNKILILAFILACFLLPMHAAAGCTTPQKQVSALLDLYSATNGPNWNRNNNWGVGDPCINQWFGVNCDNTCQVVQVLLNSNQLTGTIPSSLGNLSGLRELLLASNQLTGTIPSSIDNLTILGNLQLYSNQLTGTIPASFGSMANLYYMWLFSNRLTGTIPTSICKMINLGELKLSGNQLRGTIPSLNLTRLSHLDLGNNQLTGTIPLSFSNMTNLQALNLQFNQLTGTIPSTIGSLFGLAQLFLQDNKLNGVVPFSEQPPIKNFNISNNQYSCPLPTWCSAPPVGNGQCAPCVNDTISNNFYCCLYASDSCAHNTPSCYKDSCPSLTGEQLCAQVQTSDCSKCFLGLELRKYSLPGSFSSPADYINDGSRDHAEVGKLMQNNNRMSMVMN